LENPNAIGQRLIVANGLLWFREIAALLIEAYPDRTIANREIPNWLSMFASIFVKDDWNHP
jgi:hypothetical protein